MKKCFLVLLLLLALPSIYARSGSMTLLAVSNSEENPEGSIAKLYLDIEEGSGRIFIDSFPLSKIDTQISTRFAKEVACNILELDCTKYDFFYTIRADSPIVGGPSASAAIALLTVSVLEDIPIAQDTTITGTINTGGIIGAVGGIPQKIDAASKAGIKTVLIPKYSNLNDTNVTALSEQYGIKVIEVSQIYDALKIMTGQDFNNYGDINLSPSYVDTMRQIAEDMCSRAEEIMGSVDLDTNSSDLALYERGTKALLEGHHYSAASYCFGASLSLRYRVLRDLNMDSRQVLDRISAIEEDIDDFRGYVERQDLATITDLETRMAVVDRLIEAKEYLAESRDALANNQTNASIYQLAYGTERLNSAKSWATFFGGGGMKFDLGKRQLEESCLSKISEVEERIQYLDLYLPTGTSEAQAAVEESRQDYNNGDPDLCLYKSSIAKAKIDIVLNSIAIDEGQIDNLIQDRSETVKSILAKQGSRGIFPILAYSYYEYGNSLKETDPYSSLLYLEYALELGNLDIYFEKRSVNIPKFGSQELYLFIVGAAFGALITLGAVFVLPRR